MSYLAWNRYLCWVTQLTLCLAIPLPQPFLSVSDSKCQRGCLGSHWDMSRLPGWFRWKKNQPPVNLLAPNMRPKMNLLTSSFHDFQPFILKHLYSFKPHREVVFLTNTRTTGNLPGKCVLCWFPTPRDVLINAENSLILGSASINLWTLRAAVTTMTFLQPQRAQTYVCKPSRLSNTSFWEDGRCYQSSMQHPLGAFLLTHWEARCMTEEKHVQQPA